MTAAATSPFSLILFGASGHLAKIKLYPALYVLALKKRLPSNYAIVGFSRTEMSDEEFRTLVQNAVREHMGEVNEKVLTEFLEHVYYHTGQYDAQADYKELGGRLQKIEKSWKNGVRLAYLSVPPTVFADISKHLCEGGLNAKNAPLRCIVEKPVGHDLKSFEEIKKQFLACFAEEDIYLLDHYLGKEAVRNVYYLRFANPIIERLFKNTLIDHVEITAGESKGLEGRAGYFENVGTLRDMFQSHLLMIGSLLTMRLAETEESFVHNRYDALQQFYIPPATDLNDVVLQGQYEGGYVHGETVVAYTEEDGIADASRTNTYVAMKLASRTSRWEGVPFYVRSGKRMAKKETRISVQFQAPRKVGEGGSQNRLDIILQGEAGMRMHLQTKLGGPTMEFRPLVMEDPLVCMGDCLPEHSTLILEAIHGDHTWFLSFNEVQTAWRLMDPLQAHLDQKSTPLHAYKAGTHGPEAADEWIGKDHRKWFV